MDERLPRTAFRRLGEVPAKDLDLPGSRARSLDLLACWRRVAGEAIARRTAGIEARRGVLEVPVSEPSWSKVLRILLPVLARRIATEMPELGLHSWRLRGSGEREETTPIPTYVAVAEERAWDRKAPAPSAPAEPRVERGDPATRLRDAAERYVRRKDPS